MKSGMLAVTIVNMFVSPSHTHTHPSTSLLTWVPPTSTPTSVEPDMAQGMLQLRDMWAKADHEDVQGIQQASLLQHVSGILSAIISVKRTVTTTKE